MTSKWFACLLNLTMIGRWSAGRSGAPAMAEDRAHVPVGPQIYVRAELIAIANLGIT